MVVMFVFVVVLVMRAPVTEAHFTRQPGFSQQAQRAVNCRLPD